MTSTTDRGWIGFDLDGTLAYDIVGDIFDPSIIGDPIPEVVEILLQHREEGYEIRIFTARASTVNHHTVYDGTPEEYRAHVIDAIKEWCRRHLGFELEVTCEKDYRMKLLYDDRARQAIRNRGKIAGCHNCT